MSQGAEARLDRSALVVRIPMRFQHRGGRKRIVAPDGSELSPATKSQPDTTLVKALARAWRWHRMLEEGQFGTLAELADAERISRSYVCRVLRLALLAPDIVEGILDGRPTAGLAQFLKALPVEWEKQRQQSFEAGSTMRDQSGTATKLNSSVGPSPSVRQPCPPAVPADPEGSRSGAGYMASHGAARSSCAASAMIEASPYDCPTSWTPIGRPPSVQAKGSEMAGCPEMLKG
jgi:hypothetical protein